ncbi:aldo/keto reductase [Candidatus Woesearchaeota archaeon]|nr:aldo/keto reductase [Candidatus Woesearchaeota archaeon]
MLNLQSTIQLNNGINIPRLGLGTWKTAPGKECEQAVLDALKVGYRHIDTAAIYRNEESVGAAIKKSGIPRKDIFLTTKLWNDDTNDPRLALEQSLKKLQTDYVDLYLIHWPVKNRLDAWRNLEELYDEGKCKAIGVSNFLVHHLEELLSVCDIVPAINQVEFNPYLYQKDLLKFCQKHGIQLEAYSPLAHGKKLADKKLAAIARKYNKDPAQILIRWSLQHNLVAIPKSVHPGRITSNADVFDFQLSKEDMQQLDAMNEDLRMCWFIDEDELLPKKVR